MKQLERQMLELDFGDTPEKLKEEYCYVMQAVLYFNCLGDKCLLHAKRMSTALTQLLAFRLSYLLADKGIA